MGLLLGGWLGSQTIRAIVRPLEQLNDAMANIAQGEFNSRIAVERDDEIGIALRNVQAMQAKLGFDREEQKDTEKRDRSPAQVGHAQARQRLRRRGRRDHRDRVLGLDRTRSRRPAR